MEWTYPSMRQTVIVLLSLATITECNLYNRLTSYPDQYSRTFQSPYPSPYTSHYSPQYIAPSPFMHSFASAVPGSSLNTISRGPLDTVMPSHQPPPQQQQVHTSPHGYRGVPMAPVPSESPNSVMAEGGTGGGYNPESTEPVVPSGIAPMPSSIPRNTGGHGMGPLAKYSPPNAAATQGSPVVPVTRTMKKMVNRWATQLGYKSYYEAHGCVDPTTVLLGSQARTATFAMMLGCQTREAQQSCQMAQLAQTGGQSARTRLMMNMMLSRDMKKMFEYCLTPTTLMTGMTGFMKPVSSATPGLVPPAGAAMPGHHMSTKPDCSIISQMLMMSPSAAEGMFSPESMEQIGTMRNKYLPMTCQENLIMGSMPYRICCPGKVKPPTLQEAIMMRGMGGSA